jgi:D-alanine-D-alanine ligase
MSSQDLAVLFGGPSPEHDVSVLTGLQAVRGLVGPGGGSVPSAVHALFWSKGGEWFEADPGLEAAAFAEGPPAGARQLQLLTGPGGGFVSGWSRLGGRPQRIELDVAVNCCHGGPGEDGSLQAALDLAGVAYTGPSAAGAALGMDKLAFGGVVAAAGLPSLPRVVLSAGDVPSPAQDGRSADVKIPFPGPYIVTPRFGGSSIGIEVVADLETARAQLRSSVHLRRGAVIEPYRPDLFDLEIAVRTWPELQLSAIARPLRTSAGSDILGYSDKYGGGEGMASAPRDLPARLDSGLAGELRAIALEVARLVGTRGVGRVDFLSDGQSLYVNEVNTIPGSLARYLFVEPPVSFGELLGDLVAEARARPAAQLASAGADGRVLRSAGSISAKLG